MKRIWSLRNSNLWYITEAHHPCLQCSSNKGNFVLVGNLGDPRGLWGWCSSCLINNFRDIGPSDDYTQRAQAMRKFISENPEIGLEA